ncbi:hypothetical protein Back11_11510 [Paenibacillus baekrokdamisoli]|uniref:Uncharacterized protein n=1 Tax=Paenibacillus baekrokdamisoli TaxID=1712516 RepID=A0A3G9INC0_9BACL|nr:hypothetical protein [Paenibacillus baekrokdamisoli]MBB3070452.1 hypothetical protein [Paenibacillus baekrokdamisoli]BBH19806.1 hypothetical protein Back11_11510 [Paenibacillus baekrokdamisoli]
MINPYDFYITPDEYTRAAKNGVSAVRVAQRVRALGWSKEKAITTPSRVKKDRSHWRKVAEANGIGGPTFYDRLRRGWTEERAAKEPLCSPERQVEFAAQARKTVQVYSDEIINLRKANGINRQTFHYRTRVMKWSPERAASEPVMSRQQVGRLGAQRLRSQRVE